LRAACYGGNQRIFFGADILVFVDQQPAIALDQRIAKRLGLGAGQMGGVE